MTAPLLGGTQVASEVEDLARRRIAGYEASKDLWNQAAALKRLIDATKQEYEERFLFELIQNGYDAHAADRRDGIIEVLLDRSEGEHGVLYVANGGEPFGRSNVEAISQLAQSDKDPQDSIGNKGVGFKSVLRVCDWPEIYSAASDRDAGGTFDGYCFSFARPADVLDLVDGSTKRAEDLHRDVSPYFLPVPLRGPVPPNVAGFHRPEVATVVRLVLRSAEAADVVSRRFHELVSGPAPVHLFLERLGALRFIDRAGGNEADVAHDLVRRADAVDVASPASDCRFEVVDLDQHGRWFLAACDVAREQVRSAVQASIEAEQLDPGWSTWNRDATAVIAVPLDDREVEGRMYTYLPLGGAATAPLHGHLHAPFSTKLARTSVDEAVIWNDLLLRAAARASAAAVLAVNNLPQVVAPHAVVDLLAWSRRAPSLKAAFDDLAVALQRADLLPVVSRPDGRRLGSIEKVASWNDEDLRLVKSTRLSAVAGAVILDPALGEARVRRLAVFLRTFGWRLWAGPERVSSWLEEVALDLHARELSLSSWDKFYADVAVLMEDHPEALHGRRLLLGADGGVHVVPGDAAGETSDRLRPLVFFAPASLPNDVDDGVDGTSDVSVPRTLARTLVQMHPGLGWTTRNGATTVRTRARTFLEDEGLVRPYRAAALLEHLGRVLDTSFSEARARDALAFAYGIQQAARQIADADLRRAHLRVPTEGGWKRADEALFGADWGTKSGPLLSRLIDDASAGRSLKTLVHHRLLPPGSWQHPGDVEHFARFLARVGVRDGLWPQPREVRPMTVRDCHNPAELCQDLGVPRAFRASWTAAVEAGGAWPTMSRAKYRPRTPPGLVPGLEEHDELTAEAKELFAGLLVAGLSEWGREALSIDWTRLRTGDATRDNFRWPSPLRVALEQVAWLPVLSADGAVRFSPPDAVWLPGDGRASDCPPQIPVPTAAFRDALRDFPPARTHLTDLGVRTWDDPKAAADALELLTTLVKPGHAPDPQISRSSADAWHRLASDPAVRSPERFVVARRGRTEPWGDNSRHALIVPAGGNAQVQRLLRYADRAVLLSHPDDGTAIIERLRDQGTPAVSAAELQIRLLAEGREVRPSADTGELLLSRCDFLPRLLALLLSERHNRFVRLGADREREVLDTVSRVRVYEGRSLKIEIDGQPIDAPVRMLPLHDERWPTLVVASGPDVPISDMAPDVAELIEAPHLKVLLQRSLLLLEREDAVSPTTADLATAAGMDEDDAAAVLARIEQDVATLAELVSPVVALEASLDAARDIRMRRDQFASEAELRSALSEHLGDDRSGDVLDAARGHPAPRGVRDALSLDFVRFNAALESLGDRPLLHPEEHARAMDHHVHVNASAVHERLRARFRDAAARGERLDAYVEARQLKDIRPDPAWLSLCVTPEAELLEQRIEEWLEQQLDAEEYPFDETLESTRRANHERACAVARDLRAKVLAWSAKHGKEAKPCWLDDDSVAPAEALSGAGRLDFAVLDEDAVLRELVHEGLLPEGMPASTELAVLGLTAAEVAAAGDRDLLERQDRQRRARSVEVDGEVLDASAEALDALAARVRDTIQPRQLGRSKNLTELSDLDPAQHRNAAGASKRAGKGLNLRGPEALSDVQRTAVGLAGELVAYEWLKLRYPNEATLACWRSSYAERIEGAADSDDTLGYDFEIVLKTKTIFFEVKATLGGLTQFDLGESEVAMARACARGVDEFRIIFVSHVLQSDRRSIDVLPNPLHPDYRGKYRFPGRGLRCSFRPEG